MSHTLGESGYSYFGGIVGKSYSNPSLSNRVFIYNSLNYGTITDKGITNNNLYLGGIAGHTYYATIENCVSGGKISLPQTTAPRNSYIGSIVGYVSDETSINYCYFTSDLSDYSKYEYKTPSSESNTFSYDSITIELNETVSVGSYSGNSLIDVLNGYADPNKDFDYSHWLLNSNSASVTFKVNNNKGFSVSSQVILFPDLSSTGQNKFSG